MTSPRLLSFLGILVWSAVALTAAPRALSHRHATDVSHTDEFPVVNCSDLHVRFDHHDAVLQTEERTIPRSEAETLRVLADSNGGIQVQGWDKDTYFVT